MPVSLHDAGPPKRTRGETIADEISTFPRDGITLSIRFGAERALSGTALDRSIERERERERVAQKGQRHPDERHSERNTETRREQKGGKEEARYFGGYAWGPCRAIKLRNGGSPLDVWRELHSLVKASRNSRRYRHRRGYINVSSYVLTAYPSSPLPCRSRSPLGRSSPCASYVHRGMCAYAPPSLPSFHSPSPSRT
jgi:hypothetical protein